MCNIVDENTSTVLSTLSGTHSCQFHAISLFVSYSEVTAFTRSDGGSAPRDDLYSPERQWRPGHLDEPQRQIPSEDPVT